MNMNLSQAAAALGRKGGSVKSKRKTAAVRENGKLGGRPITTKKSTKIVIDKRLG